MTKIAILKANVSDFTANLNKAAKEAEKFKSSMSTASNLGMEGTLKHWKKTGETIKDTSFEVMKFTGALTVASAGFVAYAVNVSSSFEDAFADFRKVTEATAEEFAAIDKELKNLTKRIPASYEEIARAAASASQLGVAKEFVVGFAEAAVMMGTATNMSSEDAAESMARFSNIVGTSLGDVHKLGSAVVDLGNNFAASESEIMTMGLRLASAGKSAGMTEGDILGLAATMTSLGLRAEMGGTAMSQILNRIGSDLAHNGKEAQAWAKRAGMSVSEFRSAFEKDAVGALLALMKGLDDAVASGENLDIMLSELGINNIRQIDTMKRLVSGYDLLVEGQNRGNKAFNEGTALAAEAEMRYATFSSQVQMLRNRIRLMTDVIGGALMNVLGDLIKAITPIVDKFLDWLLVMEETNPEILDFVAKLTLLTVAILGVITGLAATGWAIGFMRTGIADLGLAIMDVTRFAFAPLIRILSDLAKKSPIVGNVLYGLSGAFRFLFTKVGPVLLIIALVVGAIYVLWNTNEGFRNAVIKIWEAIKTAYKATLGWISDRLEELAPLFEKVGDRITTVLESLKGAFENVKNIVSDFIEENGGLSGVLEKAAGPLNMIMTLFLGLKGPLGWLLRGIIELATQTSFLSDVMELLGGNISVGEFFDKLLGNIEQVIVNLSELVVEMLDVGSDMIDKLAEGIDKHLPKIIDSGLEIILKLVNSIATNIPLLLESASNIITTITDAILENAPEFADTATTLIKTWVDVVTDNIGMVIETFTGLISQILDAIVIKLPEIVDSGTQILDAIIEGIMLVLPALIETAIHLISTIIGLIIEYLPDLIDAGIEILEAVIAGIVDSIPSLIDTVILLIDSIVELIVSLLPLLISTGIDILFALIEGMLKVTFEIAKAAWILLGKLIWAIIQMLPDILLAAVKIVFALIDGLIQMASRLFDAGKNIVVKIIEGIKSWFSKIKKTGKEMMDNALGGIKEKFSTFKDAGKNIVNSIRDGINAAKDRVKGAISNVTQGIRNFLPFSPAKEGALRDIMDVKIAESIAESIRKGSNTAIRAMSTLSKGIMDESPTVDIAGQVATSNARVQSAIRHVISDDQIQTEKQPAEITFILGDRSYRVFVEDIMKEAQWIEG